MYNDSDTARLDERIENGKVVEALLAEKNKWEKEYHTLQAEVKKYCADTQKRVMMENMKKIHEEKEQVFALNRKELEGEVLKLHD